MGSPVAEELGGKFSKLSETVEDSTRLEKLESSCHSTEGRASEKNAKTTVLLSVPGKVFALVLLNRRVTVKDKLLSIRRHEQIEWLHSKPIHCLQDISTQQYQPDNERIQ